MATPFCYFRAVDEEALFRRRLQQLVLEKYGSLDRFYLETDFSKGRLSQILRGKRKSLARDHDQTGEGVERQSGRVLSSGIIIGKKLNQ